MKPRALLLSVALCAMGACSLSGAKVSLGNGHPDAGPSVAGGSALGGSDSVAGSNATGGFNLGDASVEPVTCPAGKHTSISGTVFDPAGNTPLYNAVVYIPAGPLPPFQDAVACETCPDPVKAIDDALSDANGDFMLNDVPAVTAVDLVVQLGKWRRKKRIAITPCADNKIDKEFTRLPRDHTDGDGGADLPKIALSTGHSDALECLLRKIGISDSEFTTDAGTGRVNLFVGCVNDNGDRFGANKFAPTLGGQSFPSTNKLFDTTGELDRYDMVIFSCEGHKCDKASGIGTAIQTPTHIAQLVDFANRGGRVYLDHDHYNWLNHSNVPIEKAAQFSSMTPDGGIPDPLSAKINTNNFPKGQSFAQWLLGIGASKTLGQLDIHTARTSVESLTFRAQSWIYSDDPIGFFYFTIGTPVADADSDPTPAACGRVVFTDLHVSSTDGGDSGDISDQGSPFPNGCVSPKPMMTAQEKALEFMIFDLSSCVQKETDVPVPPIVVK